MQHLRVFASVSNMEVQRIPHQQKFVNFPIVPGFLIVIDKFRLEKLTINFRSGNRTQTLPLAK
jgi:hypothetical protein